MNILTVTDARNIDSTKYNFVVHGRLDGVRVQLGFDFQHIADRYVQSKTQASAVTDPWSKG